MNQMTKFELQLAHPVYCVNTPLVRALINAYVEDIDKKVIYCSDADIIRLELDYICGEPILSIFEQFGILTVNDMFELLSNVNRIEDEQNKHNWLVGILINYKELNFDISKEEAEKITDDMLEKEKEMYFSVNR